MKIGKLKIKLSNGDIRTFNTVKDMKKYEKYAKALRHGWKPKGKK